MHGVVATFLIAGMYPVLSSMGFANTTYSDTDFTIVGIYFWKPYKDCKWRYDAWDYCSIVLDSNSL